MSTVHAETSAPAKPAAEPLNEEQLQQRAIVLVKRQEEIDSIETRILEARLGGNAEEAAEAYLYVLPARSGAKPIVGASVDFVRQAVRWLNSTGHAALSISDSPPIIQDVLLDGRAHVRVLACAVDKLTGEVKWAVKEEARTATGQGGKVYTNAHAATIALEKAERKALESHPSYNRKLVNNLIKGFLRKAGLDPAQFQIGTGGGAWSDFFGRAKAAKVEPNGVRAHVRTRAGVGLSEVATPAEVTAAAAAVDEATSLPPVPEGAPDELKTIRARVLEIAKHVGLSDEKLSALWGLVGSDARTRDDYRRIHRVVDFLSVGVPEAEAIGNTLKLLPKAVSS